MNFFKEILVFVSVLLFSNAQKYFGQPLKYCLATDTNPYLYFGSITSYDVTRGTAGSDSVCQPIQFWSLNRHGTRFASTDDLQEMKLGIELRKNILDNYAAGLVSTNDGLCDTDLLALSNWKWNDSVESEGKNLTVEGWRELKEIAQRYQKRYPELLTGYSEDQFYFRHTTEQRTWASCRAHIEGLFGSFDNIKIEIPREDDEVIRPYDNCPAWSEEVDDNDDFKKEEKRIFRKEADYLQVIIKQGYVMSPWLFNLYTDNCMKELKSLEVEAKMGSLIICCLLYADDAVLVANNEAELQCLVTRMSDLLTDVSKRLGFKKKLKKDDIDIMYDLCRFEKSWYPMLLSPWCAVFTKPELSLMEYYSDLGQFYKSGFSHPYHPKLGCLPLRNMMETFTKTVTQEEAKPRVVSLFTHDTLLNLVFTTLRFGKDAVPLKGTNYADLMVNRKFRSSLNSPFAANIAVVLHKCISGDYEVQFFLNERPMELDGCPKGLCSWEYLKKFLNMTVDCNLDFCYK